MKQIFKLNQSDLHKIVSETVKGVLQEVYPNTFNTDKLVSLNETNAKRLIDRHSKKGFAIVSACRGYADFNLDSNNPNDKNKLSKINADRTKEMINLIQSNGFSYTLTYGGFIENQGTEDEENVYERSAVIYAEKRSGESDPQGMFKLALEICKKYNQDSVLIKLPNDNPKYFTRDGNVEMEFNGDINFNDLSQTYFTDLHKNTEHKISDKTKTTRFSFTESYIAPKPQCYSESHIRHCKGEIFLKR